jgi:hypothetical protein
VHPPQNPSPQKENAPEGGLWRGRVAGPSTTRVGGDRGAADQEGMEGAHCKGGARTWAFRQGWPFSTEGLTTKGQAKNLRTQEPTKGFWQLSLSYTLLSPEVHFAECRPRPCLWPQSR